MLFGVGKKEEVSAIAGLIGIPDPGIGKGSSVYKELFDAICAALAIEAGGTMPQQAQRIVTAANLPYQATWFDSRLTQSGGGSTVTLEGLRAIKQAVAVLVQ
jgi:hypothetical protein